MILGKVQVLLRRGAAIRRLVFRNDRVEVGPFHGIACQAKAGVIINMSSVAGRFGYANRSPYCTAKWGIIGLTKTLSIELGEHGIRANAILPGAVDGPRIQRVFEGRAKQSGQSLEEIKQEAMEVQSIKRLVEPRDIAALAVFLASDAAKSISGQMLPIDNDMQQAS
jgi:NAD(P)-dependent dehydrogenase (short-subunit alcohol dehydrogenase family)